MEQKRGVIMNNREESIKRLENTKYAIYQSLKRLREALNHSNEKDIYMELGNTLLWFMHADEWLKLTEPDVYWKRRNDNKDGKLLNGLRHAYNLIKHDSNCIKSHETNVEPNFSFQLEITEEGIEFGIITFVWAENLEFPGDSDYQRKIYHKQLVGKEIIKAFEITLPFLEKEMQKYFT
jgi:hypothetical protein